MDPGDFERQADRAQRAAVRGRRIYLFVRRQPSWLTRLAVGAGGLVFVAVIVLLVLPALAAAAIVFIAGAALLTAWLWVRAKLGRGRGGAIVRYEGRRAGRENVRVRGP